MQLLGFLLMYSLLGFLSETGVRSNFFSRRTSAKVGRDLKPSFNRSKLDRTSSSGEDNGDMWN